MTRSHLFLALAVAACSGSDDTDSETDAAACEYAADWAGMEQFFTDHCDSCHPSLNSIELHADVRADVESGAGVYVVAGDPDASLLWRSVSGVHTSPMPPGDQLPETTICHVEQWIADGAPLE